MREAGDIDKAGDTDKAVGVITARLPSGAAVKVEAVADSAAGDGDGMTSVGLRGFELADALESVGEIGSLIVAKLRQAKPAKTTVELKIGFAVEAGKLTALWVGGKGEAALTVTMEWSGEHGAAADGDSGGAAESAESADSGGDEQGGASSNG